MTSIRDGFLYHAASVSNYTHHLPFNHYHRTGDGSHLGGTLEDINMITSALPGLCSIFNFLKKETGVDDLDKVLTIANAGLFVGAAPVIVMAFINAGRVIF